MAHSFGATMHEIHNGKFVCVVMIGSVNTQRSTTLNVEFRCKTTEIVSGVLELEALKKRIKTTQAKPVKDENTAAQTL